MARLIALFRFIALDRRRAEAQRSGTVRLLEMIVGLILLGGFASLFWRAFTAPMGARMQAQSTLIQALIFFWIVLPASLQPPHPPGRYLLFPISRAQRLSLRFAARWLRWSILALVTASLTTLVAVLRTDWPSTEMRQNAALLAAPPFIGFAFASAAEFLLAGFSVPRLRATPPVLLARFRWSLLLRKELFDLFRTLDPVLVLLVAGAVAASEFVAPWLTPAKALAPLLLLASFLLPAALNPFALCSRAELDRYRLMPASFARLVAVKYAALALVFLIATSPLLAVLLATPSGRPALPCIPLVLLGLLLSGLIFGRLPAARCIRMKPGTLSGEGMSFGLFFASVAVMAAPVALALLSAGRFHARLAQSAVLLAAGLLLALADGTLLARQRWARID